MKIIQKWNDKISEKINSYYNIIWEKRDSLLKQETDNKASVIRFSSRILILSGIILFIIALKEEIRGDVPIYSKIASGAVCNDGWVSNSQGPGTCSHHGGVSYYVYNNVQTGIDYANPTIFFVLSLILILIVIFLALANNSFRWASYKCIADFVYWSLFLIHRIFIILLYLPWLIIVIIFAFYLQPLYKFIFKIIYANKNKSK